MCPPLGLSVACPRGCLLRGVRPPMPAGQGEAGQHPAAGAPAQERERLGERACRSRERAPAWVPVRRQEGAGDAAASDGGVPRSPPAASEVGTSGSRADGRRPPRQVPRAGLLRCSHGDPVPWRATGQPSARSRQQETRDAVWCLSLLPSYAAAPSPQVGLSRGRCPTRYMHKHAGRTPRSLGCYARSSALTPVVSRLTEDRATTRPVAMARTVQRVTSASRAPRSCLLMPRQLALPHRRQRAFAGPSTQARNVDRRTGDHPIAAVRPQC